MSTRIGIWLGGASPTIVSQGETFEVDLAAEIVGPFEVVSFKVENDLAAERDEQRGTEYPL